MKNFFTTLTKEELRIFKKLNTPSKIQDFLETIPINFEEKKKTIMSPRYVLREKKAHCFEGALFAAGVLLFHGEKPLLLDLNVDRPDYDHVVALFRRKGKWGAISKTNHAILRYRDPVYTSPREIALSYFHEYFLDNGKKMLRSYAVFDLSAIKKNWVIDEENLWYIDRVLNRTKHIPILSKKDKILLRRADPIERKAGKLTIWKK
jgi:hypothetical protein